MDRTQHHPADVHHAPAARRAGARRAGAAGAARAARSSGPLQWALEGRGWAVLRPAVDFVLLCARRRGRARRRRTPRCTSPPCARRCWRCRRSCMLLFYLRGLYRTRLRALVLDGVVPVLSAVSVGAMAVAMLGMFAQRAGARARPTGCAPGCSRCSPSGSGASRCRSPSAGRARGGWWASRC